MCRGSAPNKKKISEMESWVNSGLRRPGDELRRASEKYSRTWVEKGCRDDCEQEAENSR